MSEPTILVADDDPDFRELVRILIEEWGGRVLEASDFPSAVDVARTMRGRIGLVLLDYFMPGDREDAVRSLRELVGGDALVLCTACGDVARRAAELGVTHIFPKPLDLGALEDAVRSVPADAP